MINPEGIYQKLVESGNEYAKLKYESDLLESRLKPLLATLAIQAKDTLNCSVSEAEKHALASNSYQKAQEGAIQAHRATLEARVGYEARKTYVDLKRTQAATERAIMPHST